LSSDILWFTSLGELRVVHIVTYDLETPHDTPADYERVIAGLKSIYPAWCHLEKSVWLVVTDQEATKVRDSLKQFLHNTDILFVARLSGNWGGFNLGTERAEWLKKVAF
jgi:hypothetical protein